VIWRRYAASCLDRRPVGQHRTSHRSEPTWSKAQDRRPSLHRWRLVSSQDRHPRARPTREIWAVEEHLQSFQQLGEGRDLGAAVCCALVRPQQGRQRRLDRRRDHRAGTPRRGWRKRGIENNARGRSRGSFTTKIHAIATTTGRPLHVQLSPGHRHDSTAARGLLKHARSRFFIADKGYDSNALIDAVRSVGMKPVICPNGIRKVQKLKLDRRAYRKRYLVEVLFYHIKRYHALATRLEKSARNYLALVHLACAMQWVPSN